MNGKSRPIFPVMISDQRYRSETRRVSFTEQGICSLCVLYREEKRRYAEAVKEVIRQWIS